MKASAPNMEETAGHVQEISGGLDRVVEGLGTLAEVATQHMSTQQVIAERVTSAPPPAAPPPVPVAPAAPVPAAPQADLSPYLDKLSAAMTAMAEAPRGGAEVIQTLDKGIYDLLDQMFDKVGDQLMPLVKGIGRRIKGTQLEADRGMTDQLDRTLKNLDMMKDLLSSLRKIDTRRLAAPPRS